MPLQDAFSLTPRESHFYSTSGYRARCDVFGVTNLRKFNATARRSFDLQHTNDELYFRKNRAGDGDATVDYRLAQARRHVPHVALFYDLSDFEPHKEVALTFRFDAEQISRVLIYSDAGLLDEEILHPGDNQFLIEVESTEFLNLYFIHANLDNSSDGGDWFFRGIDGYIA